jgi:predicted alpha/beta superfamily hydrolase
MKPAFVLHSPETQTEYSIFIEEPSPKEPDPWPVVLFMDGDDQFNPAVAAYRSLRKTGEIPPLLLAGVGYGASYSKPANKRGRDYTPTPHPDEPASGGAPAFTRFLTRTLLPGLAQRYPLSGDSRAIAGHSLGSLLALHALFEEPAFFTHFLISAPSIWWDNRSILAIASDRHARNSDLPARVFLSVGEEDTASMTGDLTLLERQLRQKPFTRLDVVTQRFPRRDHFNVLPDAFRAGLLALFGSLATPHS